jgi:glutaredoxin
MNGCPHCSEIKNLLKNENIKFYERDIDEYQEEYDLFTEAVDGYDFVPAFMIIDGENATFFAPERDYETIYDAINIIKNLI